MMIHDAYLVDEREVLAGLDHLREAGRSMGMGYGIEVGLIDILV
jgi:hypothetical protein